MTAATSYRTCGRRSAVTNDTYTSVGITPKAFAGLATYSAVPLDEVVEGKVTKLIHDTLASIPRLDIIESITVINHTRLDAGRCLNTISRWWSLNW